jgi:YcxB-like protein
VQLKYEITPPEFSEMAWLRHRSSIRWIIGICVGIMGLLLGAVFYLHVDHWGGLFLIAASVFLLLLQLIIPSLVFARFYRRNSRMFGMRIVTISDTGIVADHPLGHTETTWNMFEKFRETRKLFLLYQSADLISILPKRVFANVNDLQEVRTLIASKIRQG